MEAEETVVTAARELLFTETKKLFETENKILCEFATGSGKTQTALKLADVDQEEWQILVPKVPLVKTWEDEMRKWGFEDLLGKVKIICYASAHKLIPGNNNIILDESHRITERTLPFIKDFIGTGKLIALSATMPHKKKVLLEDLGITSHNTIKYSLDDAVDDNIIADYSIKIVQFALNSTDKNVQGGRKGAYFMTTEHQGYAYQDQQVRSSMYGNPALIKFKMLARMRFIYNLPSKMNLAQEILKSIPEDKRVIIFCGSINHANMMCAHRYHSKTTSKDYEDFCAGKINRLAVVQSVSEGVNIPDLDYALLMQVQSESLHTVQKLGRLLRKSDDPDKVGKAIILEAVGTQDSKWVSNSIAGFDPSKIEYVSATQFLNTGKL